MAKKKTKMPVPEFLQKVPTNSAAEFFQYFGIKVLTFRYYTAKPFFKIENSRDVFSGRKERPDGKCIEFQINGNANLVWVNPEDGKCWRCEISAHRDFVYARQRIENETMEVHIPSGMPWTPCEKLYENFCFLQSQQELYDILARINPYGEKFCREYQFKTPYRLRTPGVDPGIFCVFPSIEILAKAGYKFVWKFADINRGILKTEIDAFNRLCQPGTSPKTIFKTSKSVYETLKDEEDIMLWDDFRKMMKFGRISKESMQIAYDSGIKRKELGYVSRILAGQYQGKAVFTWDSLSRYLNRVDTYEAVGTEEALQLLSDYMNMCRQLGIKPKTDSDSLKREHDVAARTCRMKRDEIIATKMQASCDKMAKFNYSERTFSATAISSYDDLIDEATQQRNCVASYANYIASGRSMVFKVRETAHPEKSLITVELDPKTLNVRQKFLACNRPVRNRAQSEFIDRWIRTIKKQAVA